MSDIGWRADGIARARAAGGVELEVYRRPGFTATTGVRRASQDVSATGWIDYDPDPDADYEWSRADHRNSQQRFRADNRNQAKPS